MLWKVVQLAVPGAARGRMIFVFIWLFFLPCLLDAAASYTPMRYVMTLLLGVLVQRLSARKGSMLPAFWLSSAGFVVLLNYSPEQAIAFAAAAVVFFLVSVQSQPEGVWVGRPAVCGDVHRVCVGGESSGRAGCAEILLGWSSRIPSGGQLSEQLCCCCLRLQQRAVWSGACVPGCGTILNFFCSCWRAHRCRRRWGAVTRATFS